jgi:hypothetical protein
MDSQCLKNRVYESRRFQPNLVFKIRSQLFGEAPVGKSLFSLSLVA